MNENITGLVSLQKTRCKMYVYSVLPWSMPVSIVQQDWRTEGLENIKYIILSQARAPDLFLINWIALALCPGVSSLRVLIVIVDWETPLQPDIIWSDKVKHIYRRYDTEGRLQEWISLQGFLLWRFVICLRTFLPPASTVWTIWVGLGRLR